MSRARLLKPEFFTDSAIVRCSPLARLLFVGSWVFADDNGILPDDMLQLRMQVLPGDNCDADALKCELVQAHLWVPYMAEEKPWILIRGFCRHQTIDRPTIVYPLPDSETLSSLGFSVREQEQTRHGRSYSAQVLFDERSHAIRRTFDERTPNNRRTSGERSTNVRLEEKGIEENRREQKNETYCSEPARPASEPAPRDADPFVEAPPPMPGAVQPRQEAQERSGGVPSALVGLELYEVNKTLCRRWDALLRAWLVAYPGVDVLAEVRAAHAWEVGNPSKRKIDKARYLTNWLKRAQDRGGARRTDQHTNGPNDW